MSKAFTSEETPDPGPVVRAPPRLAPGELRYVTPEGQASMRAVLEGLRAERAAAAGPESGRAGRIAELDARIALLGATLRALTVLDSTATPEGELGFGGWVTVQDDDGSRFTWRIVGPDEVDPRSGLISVHSPVARSLLGRRAGDEVEVSRPGGARTYKVLEIRRTAT